MNKQVESYLTRKYYELKTIAKNMTKNEDLAHDLLHECIIQLYDKQDIVLKSYDDNSIKYYITSILRTNFYSKTSPFYYRIRKERVMYVDISECYDMEAEQENFELQNLYDILEISYAELNWFQKSILDLYLMLGSMKKVSQHSNIPITSISRYIKEAKDTIKRDINKTLYDE
jgi:DNA-directed RNA polymerase specialized sigma24 family protein